MMSTMRLAQEHAANLRARKSDRGEQPDFTRALLDASAKKRYAMSSAETTRKS